MLSPQDSAAQVEGLRQAARECGRDRPLHISVTPDRRLDKAVVAEYADAGVDRLIVTAVRADGLDAFHRALDANAPTALDAAARPGR
jgi:hypothetical protein